MNNNYHSKNSSDKSINNHHLYGCQTKQNLQEMYGEKCLNLRPNKPYSNKINVQMLVVSIFITRGGSSAAAKSKAGSR